MRLVWAWLTRCWCPPRSPCYTARCTLPWCRAHFHRHTQSCQQTLKYSHLTSRPIPISPLPGGCQCVALVEVPAVTHTDAGRQWGKASGCLIHAVRLIAANIQGVVWRQDEMREVRTVRAGLVKIHLHSLQCSRALSGCCFPHSRLPQRKVLGLSSPWTWSECS